MSWDTHIADQVHEVLRTDALTRMRVEWAMDAVDRARETLDQAQDALREAQRALVEDQERRLAEFDQLFGTRNDPMVLVRGYGAPEHYHSSGAPCGWASRNVANYRSIRLGEALRSGLAKCRACGERVDAAAGGLPAAS